MINHLKEYVRKCYLAPMKFALSGKNNLSIPQATRNSKFYQRSRVSEIFQEFMDFENFVRKLFASLKFVINDKNTSAYLKNHKKALFCHRS